MLRKDKKVKRLKDRREQNKKIEIKKSLKKRKHILKTYLLRAKGALAA